MPLDGYAAPRTVQLPKIGLMDDLVAKAMFLCQRSGRRNNMLPGYGIQKGERVLLGIDASYDLQVVEALKTAMRELGAIVDIIITDTAGPLRSVYGITPTPLDGADEARSIQPAIRSDLRRNPYLVREIADKHQYDLVINGTAGPIPDVAYRWEKLPWTALEHWAGEEITFPIELQMAIDEVVWEQIQRCERVRVTDPEGTDVTFTNYCDGRWLYLSHQWGKPLYITAQEDAHGVIAGTTNHRGVFNWCEATIEAGLVTSVKGGGDYGEIWREKLEEFSHLVLPPYQTRKIAGSRQLSGKHRPGFFWYWECAIGTMPKVFRPATGLYDLLYERRRSGLVHHGFGPNYDEISAMDKLGLPSRHLHIHNLFATYTGTSASGEQTVVIHNGRLTALDHPRVRAVAERFGDPDVLLREVWVPPMPGINMTGDYMRDYGGDARQKVLDEAAARAAVLAAARRSR
jgi:hypothetical protein